MPSPTNERSQRLITALRCWRNLNAAEQQYDRAKMRLEMAVNALPIGDQAKYARETLGDVTADKRHDVTQWKKGGHEQTGGKRTTA